MRMIAHHILRLSSYLKGWGNVGTFVSIGNLGGHFRIKLTTIGYKKSGHFKSYFKLEDIGSGKMTYFLLLGNLNINPNIN